MTTEELRTIGAQVASDLRAHKGPNRVPEELRRRFIAVRAELFQRGIFDPVLVRFDSATVPQASTQQIADQLAAVVASLK
jgi:hypothetical protein